MKQPKNVNQVGRLSSLWKVKVKVKLKSFSLIRLFVTPWTVAHQDPLSMGFSRQVYWSGLLFPSPGDLPDPGIEPRSPTLQANTLTSEPPGKPSTHLYRYPVLVLLFVIDLVFTSW